MEKQIKKFLQFNGRNLTFLAADGTILIAIRPICDALGIDNATQQISIKNDPILGDVYRLAYMRDTKNRLQKMLALPEKYIYGWLFNIKSDNLELKKYKWECYQVLYEYFHGSITQRHKLYEEKIALGMEIHELEKTLRHNDDYDRLNYLKGKFLANGKALKALEREELTTEQTLFN